jgi:aspartate aminotransferase
MILSQRINNLPMPAIAEIGMRAMRAGWSDMLPLAVGEPRFALPQAVQRAFHDFNFDRSTKYSPLGGYPELIDRIADKLRRVNGIDATTDNIFTVLGGSHGLYSVISVLIDPGDEVLIPDPCWEHYPNIIKLAGGQPVRFRMHRDNEHWRPDFENLTAVVSPRTRVLLVNTPLNPTGAMLSHEEICEIADFCAYHQIQLVCDEEYETFVHADRPHVSPSSIFPDSIGIFSFSKSFALTGIRLGYIFAPCDVIDALKRFALFTHMFPPSPSQEIALAVLKDDYMSYLELVRTDYRDRATRFSEMLRSVPGVSCDRPEGGVFVFPRIPLEVGSSADVLVDEYHILCVPGQAAGTSGIGHVRFFIGIDEAVMTETCMRLRKAIKKGAST